MFLPNSSEARPFMLTPYRNVLAQKTHGPRAMRGYTYNGYETVILENELVRAVIIAGRGAMVHEFQYKPLDIDVLYKNPNGLRPHDSYILAAHDRPLADYHPGGWYECFPSGSTQVEYEGMTIGFHGEVWGTPFEVDATEDSADGCSISMTGFTHRTPWKVVKQYSLKKNDPTLYLKETVSNLSHKDLNVLWGQHPFYGPPFIDEGCRIEIPATGYFDNEDKPLLRKRWPKTDQGIDLRNVGTEDFPKGKMLFATDFERGTYRIVNPKMKLGVDFNWELQKTGSSKSSRTAGSTRTRCRISKPPAAATAWPWSHSRACRERSKKATACCRSSR
jgi:galactose mutarotase-like enzyme